MLDLTKPIEIPRVWWTELIADGEGGIYGASVFGCRDIPASEAEAYRRLFEAAPTTLALLKEMYIHLGPAAQGLFNRRFFELLDDVDGASIAARQALSDLAIIDMHVPGLIPLEPGTSDFGFVNKFDATGRSLSGGDIA